VANGEDGWMSRRVTAKIMRQRASGDRDPLTDLSDREIDVVRLLAQGLTNGQMALSLGIAERTIRFHLHNIYDKIGLRGRGEAIVWAVKQEL
jgi:DNA-binding CsgD family transcriptional regulator